jgi:cytoskeletal protein CcmA (bactofilin family)
VLIVRGIVNGNIHFLKSSEGELHGMINGDVINNGGDIKIFGTIDGKVLENSGTTFVENEAVIRKKI